MEGFIKLKIDCHIHSTSDYVGGVMEGDKLPTPEQYIDRAAQLAFGAISFTNHSTWCDVREYSEYASGKGIILVPGIEMCVQRRHVLLYNFAHQYDIETFDDIKKLKDTSNLVVAAHPYYWVGKCLKGDLVKNISLFDAVEISHFFTSWLNPNKKAFSTAKKYNLPLLSFSDCHTLSMFGKNYSYVYVQEASVDGIIDGIKSGRVEHVAPPLPNIELFKEILSKRKYLKHVFLGSPEDKFLRLKKEGKLPKDFKL